ADDDYTYRVSLGQTIVIYFKIYFLQDPSKSPITDTANIIWESPWNTSYPVQNVDASGYVKLNLTSNQPWREIFVSYEEFNREKQLQLAPWRFNVEWDEITAEATITDDNEADLVDNVLNVDGNYSLTYSTSFERSNKEAAGSQYLIQINLSSWNSFSNDWDSFTGTLVEYLDSNTNITYPFVDGKITLDHLDGNGSRKFTFLDGIIPVGNMSISDIVNPYLFDDGTIDLRLQFYAVFKADLMLQTLNETGPSIAYREYTSYSGYPGPVFSSVDETSNATLQETIIWTKLRVTISTPDSRIPTLTFGTIIVEAFYAHDPTIFLDNTIRVYLADSNNGTPQSRIDWSNNKVIFSNLLSRGIVERVKYNISSFIDITYGISAFENSNNGANDVFAHITWDQIQFKFSLLNPAIRFNVNSSAFVFLEAYYEYDKTPFNGSIGTYHGFGTEKIHYININRNWNDSIKIELEPPTLQRLNPGRKPFRFINFTDNNYGLEINGDREGLGYFLHFPGGTKFITIVWDRIIVDFYVSGFKVDSLQTLPGEYVNASILVYYEIDGKLINSSNFVYTLNKNGVLFAEINRSHQFFFDHEFGEADNNYTIIDAYDYSSMLRGVFNVDREPLPFLSVEWFDSQMPRSIESGVTDNGNGSLTFFVVATDDFPERYSGSGLVNATVQLKLADHLGYGNIWNLSSTIVNSNSSFVFYGVVKNSDDTNDLRNYFVYGQSISYQIILFDKRGNSLIEQGSLELFEDRDTPNITPITMTYSDITDGNIIISFDDITDGNIIISFDAFDDWSGLKEGFIRFSDPDTSEWSISHEINLTLDSDNKSAICRFNATFEVGASYIYEITLTDRSGKSLILEDHFNIDDKSAPHLLDEPEPEFTLKDYGNFKIKVTVGDNGSLVTSAILIYEIQGKQPVEISLTELVEASDGGSGSSTNDQYQYTKTFYKSFSVPTDLFKPTPVTFTLRVSDSEGNSREIQNSKLVSLLRPDESSVVDFEVPPSSTEFLLNPIVLSFIALILLILSAIVVKRFRTISGFDKKKIIAALDQISENEVWEENDNISIGLMASFFDQIKGPNPIIWFPDRLEESEMMMATLADRSFSTLGFVPKPDDVKHATFRMHIGGEKCTVFGYAFAIENPEARGGQENLSLCFIIRPPWGNLENINKFLNELLEHMGKVKELIQEAVDQKFVQKEMEKTRNFFTRSMLLFRRKYKREFIE
ncbi:MAG: hypothetical protein ACXACU_17260, partial [Candidatus Hodarchaeales archaeon]